MEEESQELSQQPGVELVPPSVPALTTVSCLIGVVPAVIAAITQPLLGDAAMVVALELCLGAELVWGGWKAMVRREGGGQQMAQPKQREAPEEAWKDSLPSLIQ